MSTTPNLAIEHILQSQAQKEVTANEAFDALDQAIAGLLEVDVSAASTATFSFASEVTFAAGDRLAVIAPGSQDASLADISITFKGTRT